MTISVLETITWPRPGHNRGGVTHNFIAAINILRFGLNHISAGTVDYTGGEGVRANLLKGHPSAKPEAHESLAHG